MNLHPYLRFKFSGRPGALHPFPTRRSSDLGHAVRSGQQMPEGDVVRVPRVGSGAAGQGTEAGERSEPAGTLEQTTAADGGRWPGGRSVHHPVHLFVAGSGAPATTAPIRLGP